jgi:hypothetical protein
LQNFQLIKCYEDIIAQSEGEIIFGRLWTQNPYAGFIDIPADTGLSMEWDKVQRNPSVVSVKEVIGRL